MPDTTTATPFSVWLQLKVNGADIRGESTQPIANAIECLSYDQKVVTARDVSSGTTTGRRQYEPILIRKRVDKTSPLIANALAQNKVVEAVFKFFRPAVDGTRENFYTVRIQTGRILSFRQYSPESLVSAGGVASHLEEVAFVFSTISWTHVPGGVTFEDKSTSPT